MAAGARRRYGLRTGRAAAPSTETTMGPQDPLAPQSFDVLEPSGFDTMFTVFPVIFGIVFVGIIVVGVTMAVRRAKKFKDAGIDPLDPEADIAIRVMRRTGLAGPPPRVPGQAAASPTPPSPTPPRSAAPVSSLGQRLAELDALHRAGTITAAERDAARAKVLGTL
jgi:type IV secretory pathway VirB10-like protein